MAEITDGDLITIIQSYRAEAKQAKLSRMDKNKQNFAIYNLEQDFSSKIKGQSMEFIPKMAMAVEQNATFIQQGLVDIGEWFKTEAEVGMSEDLMRIKPSEIQKLLEKHLEHNDIVNYVANSLKDGLMQSLMIGKVRGEYVPKYKYKVEEKLKNGSFKKKLIKIEDKSWQLKLDLIRAEDYFPDPTGRGLYELEDIYLDYYKVMQMAEQGIYDIEKVKLLKGSTQGDTDQEYKKARESGQNVTNHKYRHRIKLTEVWGNIINSEGELIFENCMCTIANDTIVLQRPVENPMWHGESPYVVAPLVSKSNTVWPKAVMDAPAALNKSINEMFNLIIDGGMMAVHGIKQIREHWLEDASQVEAGISAGDTSRVNTSCPPGATALERVDTSSVPQDGLNVMNLLNQEFFSSAMTNDLRMGVAPFRAVKATEVVEASQTITGMYSGMAKQIESNFITKLLEKSWKTIAQHTKEIDSDSLGALLGESRASEIGRLSNEELFAETVQGCKFKVFGISATLNKQKDFVKLQSMLQTISTSPVLMEEFVKKYDFGKLLGEIMKSLDIRQEKIAVDKPMPQASPMQAEQGLPDQQSQIPMAGADANNPDPMMSQAQGGIPSTEFPGSKANVPMMGNN